MRLTFEHPHRLAKLHDELVAAIPELTPVAGLDGALEAVWTISGDGQHLELEVPDDVDEQAIRAVVDAHDPTTPSAGERLAATEEANERTSRDKLAAALDLLEDDARWNALSAAAKQDALRKVEAGLIRLQLRRLDKAAP